MGVENTESSESVVHVKLAVNLNMDLLQQQNATANSYSSWLSICFLSKVHLVMHVIKGPGCLFMHFSNSCCNHEIILGEQGLLRVNKQTAATVAHTGFILVLFSPNSLLLTVRTKLLGIKATDSGYRIKAKLTGLYFLSGICLSIKLPPETKQLSELIFLK